MRPIVDLTKRYNEVTWAMAHDSHTVDESDQNPSDQEDWNDQTYTVDQQLVGGIRAVRISTAIRIAGGTTHYEIVLHHGLVTFWTLKRYLTLVRDFLNQPENRNEIVTIIDEGSDKDAVPGHPPNNAHQFEDKIASSFQDIFGGQKSRPGDGTGGLKIFIPGSKKKDGTAFPTLDEMIAGNWPVLQDLVDANARILYFMKNGYPHDANPWILNAYGMTKTGGPPDPTRQLMFSNPCQFLADADRRPTSVKFKPDDTDDKGGKGTGTVNPNSLYIFQHFFYAIAAIYPADRNKDALKSQQAFSKWTVGDLLVVDTLRAWCVVGQRPNFINVDFYQGTHGARSYLLPLVNALNQVPHRAIIDVADTFFPIHIQDTNEEDDGCNGTREDNPQTQANVLLAGTQANYAIQNKALNTYLGFDVPSVSYAFSDKTSPFWALWSGYQSSDFIEQLTGFALVIAGTFSRGAAYVSGNFGLVWEADSSGRPTGKVRLDGNYLSVPTPQRGWEIRYVGGDVQAWVVRVSSVLIDGKEQQDGSSWYLTATDSGQMLLTDKDDGDSRQHWIFTLPTPPSATVFAPAPVQPFVPTPKG